MRTKIKLAPQLLLQTKFHGNKLAVSEIKHADRWRLPIMRSFYAKKLMKTS